MDPLNVSMFRAYDIRTPSVLLSDELARRLAKAEAAYVCDILKAPGVLLAHDARSTGPHYLELAAGEFVRAGLEVLVIPHPSSASMFYFAAMSFPHLAAILYGASHNPAGDTGQKILAPGVRPVAEHIGPEGGLDCIRDLYLRGVEPGHRAGGRIRAYDPTEPYIAYSMERAGVEPGTLRGLHVLHDYLNGSSGREMMLAFDRAGAALTPLHFTADGRFPLGDPNPVKQDVIRHGLQTLASGRFLLGIFFDGDGDRIDFYRGDGTYLSSSFVYAAILPQIRARFPGSGMGVFADLKSNPLAVMEMARAGVRVQVIRNGHSQIKNSLFEDASMFGAVEESAHFYEAFPAPGNKGTGNERFCTENTLYVALLVSRVWLERPEVFDALVQIQSRTSREREWGYKFPSDELRAAALDAVRAHFEALGAQAMTRMPNGYELEATLMRRGIPFDIDADTRLSPDWLQVCQRVSQSEEGLARWEVVAATREIASEAKKQIAAIVQQFQAGPEYQG
ncbi:MAG: phosphoglucomutase [Chthonomonadales bacterium]